MTPAERAATFGRIIASVLPVRADGGKLQGNPTWRELFDSLTPERAQALEGLYGEQLRAEVALLERAMDRCERVLIAMARLNIDERIVRLSDRQASLVVSVLKGALDDLGIDRSQAEVGKAIARRLRMVAAQERQAIPGSVTDPGSS